MQGSIEAQTSGAAFVKFVFTGAGCSLVDVLASITASPPPIELPASYHGQYQPTPPDVEKIAVKGPASVTVAAWFVRRDAMQTVTAHGTVQCEGLEHPGAEKEIDYTVAIPPREDPEVRPPGPDSFLNQSEKDNLTSGAKGGAVTTALLCIGTYFFPPAGEACALGAVGAIGLGATSRLDPPDPSYRKLLTASFTPSTFTPKRSTRLFTCKKSWTVKTRRACAKINVEYRSWLRDQAEMAWLAEAAAVSSNREQLALKADHDGSLSAVVSMHRAAIVVYLGRWTATHDHSRVASRQLAVKVRHKPFAWSYSVKTRTRALRGLATRKTVPKKVLRRLERDHLPVRAGLASALKGVTVTDVPRTLHGLFANDAATPLATPAQVLAGSGSDPAASWPAEGVVRTLRSWLGGSAIGTETCDDEVLGNRAFVDRLASLRREQPQTAKTYAQLLARTQLAATAQLRRPCAAATPSATTYTGVPEFVVPTDGSFGSSAGFERLADGSVIATDSDAQTVTRYGPDGLPNLVIGGDDKPVFDDPLSVAVAANGDIFVTDFNANRVLRFDSNGTYLNDLGSGSGSEPGQWSRPSGIVVTADQEVVVVDALNVRLKVYTPDGTLIRVIDSPTDGQPGHLVAPRGVDVSASGTIAVVDRNTASVVEFRLSDGAFIGASAPNDDVGEPAPTGLVYPYSPSFDGQGDLWIADKGGAQLVKFHNLSKPTKVLDTFGFEPSYTLSPRQVQVVGADLYLLDSAAQQVVRLPAVG